MQLAPSIASVAGSPRADLASRLQSLADGWRAATGVPGVELAVRLGEETVAVASGLADVEHGIAMRPDTQLRVASVSKTFVAAAVLRLVERGALKLDESIERWFPGMPDAQRVTVRDLLRHTSGVADYAGSAEFTDAMSAHPGQGWTHEHPTQVATSLPLGFQPGTRFEYSNSNYHLLGTIVERVAGQSLLEHLRSTLLRPLGLNAVRLDDGSGPSPAGARAYVRDSSGENVDATDVYHGANSLWRSTGWADGAVVASAPQLARWG